MKQPKSTTINIDSGTPLVYVYYVETLEGAVSKRISSCVVIDVDASSGALLGIELLDTEPDTLETARKVAVDMEAAFPAELAEL